ncbi:Uncharacterized protein Fot_02913 [Forsythia ovata]|uniref:Uncharacterized protein n=1 Tax=Forsythia ovata TaxID=205694 RepID=A0ABD1X885_9LAMI
MSKRGRGGSVGNILRFGDEKWKINNPRHSLYTYKNYPLLLGFLRTLTFLISFERVCMYENVGEPSICKKNGPFNPRRRENELRYNRACGGTYNVNQECSSLEIRSFFGSDVQHW